MALFSPFSLSFHCFSRVYPHQNLTNHGVLKSLLPRRCFKGLQICNPDERPLANYQPTSWSYEFVKSLNSPFSDNMYQERVKNLEDVVRLFSLEDWSGTPLALLEFIDDMERLGTGYHFKNEIWRALEKIAFRDEYIVGVDDNLYATSLKFRLLRQHGYEVSQENKNGDFIQAWYQFAGDSSVQE